MILLLHLNVCEQFADARVCKHKHVGIILGRHQLLGTDTVSRKEAKDPVLVNLFTDLHKKEQQHFDSLGQVLNGTVPNCNCNDSDGKNYNPTATYSLAESEDKKNDCFLATDCIWNTSPRRFSPGSEDP